MVNQNDIAVLEKFSINEEGELIVAKQSSTIINYTYFDGNGNQLTLEQAQEIIPEEDLGENINQITITAGNPINYKTRITKYTASYGLLSDLLITTKNVDFCLELAQLALNSKIVINVNEEVTKSDLYQTTYYDQTTLLYDYVKYEISGTESNTTTSWKEIVPITEGNPSDSTVPSQCGWSRDLPSTETGSSQGGTRIYNWSNNGVNYKLTQYLTRSGNSWKLEKEIRNTTESTLQTEQNENNTEDGELINLNNLKEETLENEEYTDKEELKYTIKTETHSKTYRYVLEIGEVDTWCMKYNKEYDNPIEEATPIPEGSNVDGEYSEIIQVLKTTDVAQIEADTHVQEFKAQRIRDYKNDKGADDATCNFEELTVKQRVKTDVTVTYDSATSIIAYKFGEENADTTEVSWKNVEFINNEPSFTKKDIDGNQEIGFLYLYDKYTAVGIDLYLENDAEEKLFDLLETDPETSNTANIIRYLLFVYDGIDRGVTELDLSLYKPGEMNDAVIASSVLLKKYIHSWEHSSPPPTNADGTCYIIEDDGAGHPTVGYGVDIENSGYKYLFEQNGYSTEIGGEVPIDFVDGIEDMIIEDYKQEIEAAVSGLDLTGYQINALVSRAYNCGVDGAISTERGNPAKDFVDSYLSYWNQETDDQFEEKDNEANFNHELYEQYMSKPVTSEGKYRQGLKNRRDSEWILFQTGYYDTLDTWHMNGESILEAAAEVHNAQMSWSYALTGLPSGNIEASLNNPNRVTCCATYVSSVIYVAGYVTEEEINDFTNYNYVLTLYEDLKKLGWEEIYSYDELQPRRYSCYEK